MKHCTQYMLLIVTLSLASTATAAWQVPDIAQLDKQVPQDALGSPWLTETEKQNDVLKRQTDIIKELYTRVMKLEEKVKRLESERRSSNE